MSERESSAGMNPTRGGDNLYSKIAKISEQWQAEIITHVKKLQAEKESLEQRVKDLEKTLSSLATQSEFVFEGSLSPEDLLEHLKKIVENEKYMRRKMDHLYRVISNVVCPVDISSGENFVGQTRNVGEPRQRRQTTEFTCHGCEEKFPNRPDVMRHKRQCPGRSKPSSAVINVPKASTSLVENTSLGGPTASTSTEEHSSAEQHGVDVVMDDDIVDVEALPASASSTSSVWRQSSQNGA